MESTVLVKAFSILETLAARREPVSLAELTDELKLNKPTIHRILQDLIGLGYVQRVGGGVYSLTNKLIQLSLDEPSAKLLDAGHGLLSALHDEVQETVNLGVLRQDRVSYLLVLESPHPLRRVVGEGTMDPFYSTALGRAIVSRLPKERWNRLLDGAQLRAQTPNTVIDKDELLAKLDQAKEQGFADEWEENDVGVMCVAVPILCDGDPVAAVSLTVPLARMDDKRERELVVRLGKTASALERLLDEPAAAV